MPLKVITGPMFAGKSSALYRYVERALRSRKTVDVVTPKLDKDGHGHAARTHDGLCLTTLGITPRVVESSKQVFSDLPNPPPSLLVVDEAQFFDMDLPMWVEKILAVDPDLHVIAAGLDLTSEGETFGPMGQLLARADKIKKLKAICDCGVRATRTACNVKKTGDVLVGADPYVPKCRKCWVKHRQQNYL